ncbi:MAG: HAD-IA family hydrolase [Bacilli bacterium]|nr:HAD-IA family hydrolase [Bacilli bacterium]
MLKNIIFDYNGVLRYTKDIPLYDYLKILFPNHDLKHYKTRRLREYIESPLIKRTFDVFDLGFCDVKKMVKNVSIILGEDPKVVAAIFKAVIDPNNNVPMLDVINFTKELYQQGYNLYIFSNLNKPERDAAPKEIDFSIFKDTLFSCDVGFLKPNLDYYIYAVKKWGIKPQESLFIDDNPDNLNNFYLMNGYVFLFDENHANESLMKLRQYIKEISNK